MTTLLTIAAQGTAATTIAAAAYVQLRANHIRRAHKTETGR